jgi:hypothetical protein
MLGKLAAEVNGACTAWAARDVPTLDYEAADSSSAST